MKSKSVSKVKSFLGLHMCNMRMMCLISVCVSMVAVVILTSVCLANRDSSDGTELVMTFMIIRHGNRTPLKRYFEYVADVEKVLSSMKAQNIGYGQLTESGKQCSYKVGTFIRNRYDELLSPYYNVSEIFIRSAASTRVKMTALAAMSAVYPVQDKLDDNLGCKEASWSYVPYSTDSPFYDFIMTFFNCPKYLTALFESFIAPAPEMSKHNEFLNELSQIIGINITQRPNMVYVLLDAYNSQISLEVSLPPEIEKIFPKIEEAATTSVDLILGNEDYIHLGAGVLLKEFFNAASKVISGEDVPKVYVYFGHDINVYTLMAVSRITPRQGPPKYGALYALELLRVVVTGQYIVKPIYLNSPNEKEVINLKVDGCEDLCDLSTFHELVARYELDVKEWRVQCEWSEDYDYDYGFI